MKLYLARHGATDWNQRHVYQGWSDVLLSNAGVEQCAALRDKLHHVQFDRVLSSTLERAIASAQLISGLDREKLMLDPDLREMHFGLWEGLTYREIERRYPLEWQAWGVNWRDYCVPQGESFNIFQQRVNRCLNQRLLRYEAETVLLVSHDGVLKVIVSGLLQLPIEGFWKLSFEFGCYTMFDITCGIPVLKKVNV